MAGEGSAPDGTGQGLVEFFDWVAEKGLMNKNTSGALRAACTQVLAVEAKDLTTIDVRTLDLDELGRRFANLRKQDFKPESLHAYQARFRKAVEMYLSYLSNPSGWRPPIRERTSTPNGDRGRHDSAPNPPSNLLPPAALIEYPFPIRDGVVARLQLPIDLRKTEAKRLAAFLDSLAIEQQLALPVGSDGTDKE